MSGKAGLLGIAGMFEAALLAFCLYLLSVRTGVIQELTSTTQDRKAVFVLFLLVAAFMTYGINRLAKRLLKPTTRSMSTGCGNAFLSDQQRMSRNDPADDSIMLAIPDGLPVELSQSQNCSTIRVLGRGINRGPAVIFAFAAIVMSVVSVIAAVKVMRHGDHVTMQGLLFTSMSAVLLWLVALWRGSFATDFELDQGALHVFSLVPLLGRMRCYTVQWSDIREINIAVVPPGNFLAPGVPCLEIDDAAGSRRRFLRGYSIEGIQWVVATLERFRPSYLALA